MEHYFTRRPKSKLNLRKINVTIKGIPFRFYTGSSVFSPKRIDRGTLLLIEKMEIKRESKVLDIGCGYGVIGIVVAKICPTCKVYMSDINERAIMLTLKNLKENRVKARVRSGNLYEPWKDIKFDVILSNPPMSAGKGTCFKIIEGAYDHLEEGGNLQIVVKYRKGGKIIKEKLEEVFDKVEVMGKGGGFRVFKARKAFN